MAKLPQNMIDALMEDLLPANGIWSDFHCDLRAWNAYYDKLVLTGLISIDDMPPKPVYTDYGVDLTTARTHCTFPSLDP